MAASTSCSRNRISTAPSGESSLTYTLFLLLRVPAVVALKCQDLCCQAYYKQYWVPKKEEQMQICVVLDANGEQVSNQLYCETAYEGLVPLSSLTHKYVWQVSWVF